MMDFITVLIFLSIGLSTLLMIIGPLLEWRGIIFFEKSKCPPRTKNRYGMMLMFVGAVLFIGGCVARNWISSAEATRFVFAGFILWFIGGFVSVIRNEVIRALEGGGNAESGSSVSSEKR